VKPLEGIRVLDFSRVLAGPYATMILAELGAEVIKIEQRGTGDETRGFEPQLGEQESGYFFAFNRAKRSVTLNLRKPAARDLARRMAEQADVLVENFPVGTMDKFGLGWTALREANPRLIYLSNTAFGQTGPYAPRKGYDTIFQAMGGMMALTGEPGGGPCKAGLPTADLTSGMWAAISVLAALQGRASSGRGARIDLSMFDVQVSLLTIAAARFFATGEVPARTGTEHLGRVPSAAFQCRDGRWLHITGSDQHWAPICRALKLDDLAADPALAKNAGRVADRDRVMRRMREAISAMDRDALLAACDAMDVPAGPVNAVDEALQDPHTRARGLVGEFEHPTVGKFPGLAVPLKFDGFDDLAVGRPPLLGEHTEEVLKSMLGLDDRDIAALREEEAI
jgi:crotonobetainyl-CoA:carnitine CoA-transferase CaiB-like acyl-CoA transferase